MSKHPKVELGPLAAAAPAAFKDPPRDIIPATVRRRRSGGEQNAVMGRTPWWNNIRRAWFVDGPKGPELVDPQPPPPAGAALAAPSVAVPNSPRIVL